MPKPIKKCVMDFQLTMTEKIQLRKMLHSTSSCTGCIAKPTIKIYQMH